MSWYLDAGPKADVVFSTRVRLARNVADFPFPARLEKKAADQLFQQVRDAIFNANGEMPKQYRDLDLTALSPVTALALAEQRLISDEMVRAAGRQDGIARTVISKDESVSIMIGEEDHIRIQAMAAGLDLETAYKKAEDMALLLEEKLPIAYDEQFGFLTACPTNTGTGVRASVMVHLPALTINGSIISLKRQLERFGFTVRGAYGEHSDSEGRLYQISNQVTLGLSEWDILNDLKRIITQIIDLERAARQELKTIQGAALEDRLWRNIGVMRYARSMTHSEALSNISDLALGAELGLYERPNPKDIKRLLAAAGVGSIQQQAGRILSAAERDQIRAETIRQLLNYKQEGA